MQIWVTSVTGTWGNAKSVRIVELPEPWDVPTWESWTDAQRARYAEAFGRAVV
jgi:hypothetical protein